ncbi:hypothetical protein GQ53DRAFT_835774 [Thozetella sp. PMI_491]|nr:hypothetical protein GQ53DRAFT_835774 [Thozetella sp. PMI_491]
MASSSAAQPKFAWESDVPAGPFWQSPFNENYGRQFIRVFTAEEISALDLDGKASLSEKDKLLVLEPLVIERIKTQPLSGPPETLSHDEFENKWQRREFLLAHIHRELGRELGPELGAGRLEEAERRLRNMIEVWEKREDPERKTQHDLGSIDNLGILYWETGRLAEAEEQFRLCIKLLLQVPEMGFASPMNAGMLRKLTEVLGEQGRYDEAFEVNEEALKAVEALGKTRFAKYELMLKTLNEEARRKVQVWRFQRQQKEKAAN